MRRRSFFRRAYPFVVSVYLVLYLAARNPAEWFHFWELLVPILVSLGLAIFSWCTAELLTKDSDKRAFLACVGVVLLAGLATSRGSCCRILLQEPSRQRWRSWR
jgi:hypothetical protein